MTNEEYQALLLQDDTVLEAGKACEFLAIQWGIPYYSKDALKARRLRGIIKSDDSMSNGTRWKIRTLKSMPKPVRGRKKQEVEADDNGSSSVVLMSIGLRSGLTRHVSRELAGVS